MGKLNDISDFEKLNDDEIDELVNYIYDKASLEECYRFIESHPNIDKKGWNSAAIVGGASERLNMFLKNPKDVVEDGFVKTHYKDKDTNFLLSFLQEYNLKNPNSIMPYNKISWYMVAHRLIELIKSNKSNDKLKYALICLFKNSDEVANIKQKLYDVIPKKIMGIATVDGQLHPVALILWLSTHTPVRFLGKGHFGEVWEVESKVEGQPNYAVKVISTDKSYEEEKLSSEKLKKLFANNPKAIKYLIRTSTPDYGLVSSELAEGDLDKNYKTAKLKEGKTIRSSLSKMEQALKAVKSLHDEGYSHNDIKPANFLRIDVSKLSSAIKVAEKTDMDKEKHTKKHRIKLSDFGTLTRIDGAEQAPAFTRLFIPSEAEFEKLDKESVSRRDVFALGLTFIDLLLKRTSIGNRQLGIANDVVQYLRKNGAEETCQEYNISGVYSGTPKKEIINLLKIIYDMIKDKYIDCISVDEAIRRIKTIKPKP